MHCLVLIQVKEACDDLFKVEDSLKDLQSMIYGLVSYFLMLSNLTCHAVSLIQSPHFRFFFLKIFFIFWQDQKRVEIIFFIEFQPTLPEVLSNSLHACIHVSIFPFLNAIIIFMLQDGKIDSLGYKQVKFLFYFYFFYLYVKTNLIQ